MPAVRPMLRAVGHGVPTAHGPKWADSCGSRWEQRVLLRPPVDEQLGRNALREVRESDHPMTTPDPLALAAALRAAHEENKRLVTQAAELGKWRDAVLNAAVVDWTYRKEHETDPVRAVNDLVCYALDVEREALRKENQRLREALPLARLGLAALEVSRDGDNWDGWDIQDAAVSLGAVVSVEVGYGRYCGEDCRCAEMAADYCYRDAPSTITTRALAGGKGDG